MAPSLPPEILVNIEQHLARPDILTCVQVSKDWHDFFSSTLWRTFDDSRLIGFRKCLLQHWCQHFCTCNVNSRSILLKYGEHIRHLVTGWSLTIAVLLSAPNLRSRICSLVLLNNVQFPLLTRYQVTRILCAHQQEIGGQDQRDDEKILDSFLLTALSDHAKYQRRLHARLFVQLLLQNAATLTKLHFKDRVDMLSNFLSMDTFYGLLASLPCLGDLQVAGDDISIVALKQVLPSLTNLHLTTKSSMVLHPPGCFQYLLRPLECCPEGPNLPEKSDDWPITSLSLGYNINYTELHRILAHFQTIQHLSVAIIDTHDLNAWTQGDTLEHFRSVKSFKIMGCRKEHVWHQRHYLISVLPNFLNLKILTLPAPLYNDYKYYLVKDSRSLASVRIVKNDPSRGT